ncbi:MAG: Uma2 family endonuclease [Spirulina sp. SIO3F2]|nr:Uma2 family endonuclease [Spirulina sp. SIO3F2]
MVQTPIKPQTLYPDSDGKPMADNTEQYQWITRLVTNLKHLLRDQTAFVAGDLLWYPVQVAENETPPSQAPDAMVAFGQPQGKRGSYKQWEEDGIAPQVIFEVLSPSNTRKEMAQKQDFYTQHGVLEMYYYDPQRKDFWGFVRETHNEVCMLITALYLPWVSPLLNIRFEMFEDGLAVYHPDGKPFKDPEEFALGEAEAQTKLDQAETKLDQTEAERDQLQTKLDQAIAKLQAAGLELNDL